MKKNKDKYISKSDARKQITVYVVKLRKELETNGIQATIDLIDKQPFECKS